MEEAVQDAPGKAPSVPQQVTVKPPGADSAPAPSGKFSGKFDSPDAQVKGYVELHKLAVEKLGVPPLAENAKLYGEGGMFKDITEVEQHYATLEKAVTRAGPKEPAKKPEAKTEPTTDPLKVGEPKPDLAPKPQINTKDWRAIVKAAGLDEKVVADNYAKTGTLTEAEVAAIAGVTKWDADRIAERARGDAAEEAYKQVTISKIRTDAIAPIGGDEAWAELDKWASETIKPEQLAPINKRLASLEPGVAADAVQQLELMRLRAMGAGGSRPLAGGPSHTPSGPSMPQTFAEVRALQARADQGDDNAKRVLNAIPDAQFRKLMNSGLPGM